MKERNAIYKEIMIDVEAIICKSGSIDQVCDALKSNEFDGVSLLKEPRWSDDALILKCNIDESAFTIKIHYEKYPIASHLYNTKAYLDDLGEIDSITTIRLTKVIRNNNGVGVRVVVYDYVDGIPLDQLLKQSDESLLTTYKNALRACVLELMLNGYNVFVRDLGDFIFVDDKVVLTDYNALFECRNASQESKEGIMDIIDQVIESVVVKSYKPFVNERPFLK